MPLDSTGAPAPRSLSRFIDRRLAEHRARLKKLRARASKAAKPRRRFDEGRLARAEYVLGQLILGADYLGHGPEATHFLLIAMQGDDFGRLCELGAELEDVEENGDHEPDVIDEPSLGSADAQPNQIGWAQGAGDDDREDDEEREDDQSLV